jgi:hypothetical protein
LIEGAKFLLDQNFPNAPFDAHVLDRTVTYVHFSHHAPEFAEVSTPDWMVYLIAADGGFDGVVTSDKSQLDQDTELIGLIVSGVNLITWDGRQLDPVTLWGQLIAYMPQVLRALEPDRPSVVTLPNPRLQRKSGVESPGNIARSRKVRDKLSFDERRSRALAVMRSELEAQGREEWLPLLDRSSR